jgi:hypothetical protein
MIAYKVVRVMKGAEAMKKTREQLDGEWIVNFLISCGATIPDKAVPRKEIALSMRYSWTNAEDPSFASCARRVRAGISWLQKNRIPVFSTGNGFIISDDRKLRVKAARTIANAAVSMIDNAAGLLGYSTVHAVQDLALPLASFLDHKREREFVLPLDLTVAKPVSRELVLDEKINET